MILKIHEDEGRPLTVKEVTDRVRRESENEPKGRQFHEKTIRNRVDKLVELGSLKWVLKEGSRGKATVLATTYKEWTGAKYDQRLRHSEDLKEVLQILSETLPRFIDSKLVVVNPECELDASDFNGTLDCEHHQLFPDLENHCHNVIQEWELFKEKANSYQNALKNNDTSTRDSMKNEFVQMRNSLVKKIQYYLYKPLLDGDCKYLR